MLPLYDRIEELCKIRGVNITEMCRAAGIPRSALSDYKTGRKKSINLNNMTKMADYFGVSIDELTGREIKENAPALTDKDKRDIAMEADRMIDNLEGEDELMFDGVPLTPEARDSLRAAFRLGLEAARLKNKETYTPKKYRK